MTNRSFAKTALLAAVFASITLPLGAQSRDDMLLEVPTAGPIEGRFGRTAPGVTTSSPIAFGPASRDVFAGFGYQNAQRFGGASDGAAAVGFGLFNPATVGVEVTFTSLSTIRSGFFDRTVGGLKLHRLLPWGAAIGVGVEGLKLTGENFETTESVFATYSQFVNIREPGTAFSSVILNAGVGNGRFCAVDNDNFGALKDCSANVFASAALRANLSTSFIADWTGQDLNLGISVAPFRSLPIVITPVLADVVGTAGDGIRFAIGAGFATRF
jgi:hypothetical protein